MCEQNADLSDEEIDVRSLIPAQRHAKIFQHIDELAFGASFVLVNDHDPKPLYYQLEAEYPRGDQRCGASRSAGCRGQPSVPVAH